MLFHKPKRRVSKVFIHCSATSRASVTASEVRRWHAQRGWSDIGYHYFIRTDGTVEAGRPTARIPAAQAGHNRGSIAICLNGLEVKDFTNEQFSSLIDLCKQINDEYNGKITFHGHCEVSPKTCPVFDYKKVLKLNNKGKLGV